MLESGRRSDFLGKRKGLAAPASANPSRLLVAGAGIFFYTQWPLQAPEPARQPEAAVEDQEAGSVAPATPDPATRSVLLERIARGWPRRP